MSAFRYVHYSCVRTFPMIGTIWEIVYDSATSLDWNCFVHADFSVTYSNLIISGMLKANELTLFYLLWTRIQTIEKLKALAKVKNYSYLQICAYLDSKDTRATIK